MIALLKSKLLFFASLGTAWVIVCMASLSGAEFTTHVDTSHTVGMNVFFINYTFMADGIFILTALAVYYFYFNKKRETVNLFITFVCCELIVQSIKNMYGLQGLQLYFENGQYLFVSREEFQQPFFSGHTAVAFAMITMIVFNTGKKWLQFLLLIAGLLMAYSRMHLGLQTLEDVALASFIGTVTALLSFYILNYQVSGKIIDKKVKTGNLVSPVHIQPA